MRSLLAALSVALLLPTAPVVAQMAGMSSAHGAPPPLSVSLNANLSLTGYTIPSGFAGYSINTSAVIQGYLTGSGSLCSLAKLVGATGVLRIGGLDQDTTPSAPALTQNIANGLEAFRACLGSGWKLIYGLDSVINNSATAASQATLIANASGANAIFQFGNEPIDGSNFTVNTYQTMWNSYQTAVAAAVPGVKLAAWDDGNFGSTQTAISGLTGGLSGLTYVTQHYYNPPCATSETASQLIGVLIANTGVQFSSGFTSMSANLTWSTASGVPTRLTETNTICSGGVAGTSDRMMAATWFLNMAIILANNGYDGVNIHNNLWWPSIGGAPILLNANPNTYGALWLEANGNFIPGPIFYGMYLFSKIQGRQTVSLTNSGNSFVQAIATKGGNGNANILAANNSSVSPITVTPAQSSAWTTANVLQIKSPSGNGCSEASPTIGGQAIGESGAWSGAPFAISNGQSVTLAPCEAALIQIQP